MTDAFHNKQPSLSKLLGKDGSVSILMNGIKKMTNDR